MNLTTRSQRVAAACTSVVTTFLPLAALQQQPQAQVQMAHLATPAQR